MKREPLEPLPSMPVKFGFCDYCGDKCKATYCNAVCQRAYSNIGLRHGKAMIQLLKIWRLGRHANGPTSKATLGDITFRLDQLIAEDRDRRAEMTRAREAAA